jgi:ribosomal protein S18 acetylase RimI-like enzyme
MAQGIENVTTEIRAAQPTAEEASHFVELTNMASHDLMSDLVGRHSRNPIASLFLRDDNLFGYPFSQFAVVGGKIAGLLYAFSQEQKVVLGLKTSLLLLGRIGLMLPRTLWVQFHLQQLFSFMDMLLPDAYYIQCLAVYSEFRRQGISKHLLAKADELARQARCKTVELDTEADNTVAIDAYKKHGMEITGTSPVVYSRIQRRQICLYRMVKTLA